MSKNKADERSEELFNLGIDYMIFSLINLVEALNKELL